MHPFIIIGGVIVMAVTAAIGIPQVIGWVDSANDGAAKSDLAQIATVQEAGYTIAARYGTMSELNAGAVDDIYGDPQDAGVRFQESQNVNCDVAINSSADQWAAVCVSRSGRVFVRSYDSSEVIESESKNWSEAIDEVNAQTSLTVAGTASSPTISGL